MNLNKYLGKEDKIVFPNFNKNNSSDKSVKYLDKLKINVDFKNWKNREIKLVKKKF